MLVNGRWKEDFHPYQSTDKEGGFVRQNSSIRRKICGSISSEENKGDALIAEKNRYHLYVSYTCPWASRALIVHSLKKLEDIISVSVVEPFLTDEGWKFGGYPGSNFDELNGVTFVHQLYTCHDSMYSGRATVPVLWDKKQKCIVNNESADIIEQLNTEFFSIATETLNLRPEQKIFEINELNKLMYDKLNNGVYKCGFAKTQKAYVKALDGVFSMLDHLDELLENKKFLFGDKITESDVRLFVTLIRFDTVYFNLFKCNLRRIIDYKNLQRYMLHLLEIPSFKISVNFDHIKQGYYSIKALNPYGIVPLGPKYDFQF